MEDVGDVEGVYCFRYGMIWLAESGAADAKKSISQGGYGWILSALASEVYERPLRGDKEVMETWNYSCITSETTLSKGKATLSLGRGWGAFGASLTSRRPPSVLLPTSSLGLDSASLFPIPVRFFSGWTSVWGVHVNQSLTASSLG